MPLTRFKAYRSLRNMCAENTDQRVVAGSADSLYNRNSDGPGMSVQTQWYELPGTFGLLLAALLIFLLSAHQSRLTTRLSIWVAGVACIAGAAALNAGSVSKLFSARVGGVKFVELIWKNLDYVAGYAVQALLVLFALTVAAGVIALVALTLGEGIERSLRRFGLIIIGVVVGALLALAIVALGIGGNTKRSTFVSIPNVDHCAVDDHPDPDCDVVDGDTIRMGDISLRLVGINAPELSEESGRKAKGLLIELLKGHRPLVCAGIKTTGTNDQGAHLIETFGRPVVQCGRVDPDPERTDIGLELVRKGVAIPCRHNGHPDIRYWSQLVDAWCARSSHESTLICHNDEVRPTCSLERS